ncbi:hypothetical protein NM688_g3428 [Phlebia brevispora]|uniref:Uncharacterized protein n=1 Tax=Phlebia brevispora TaxID=194682 RepID=A0ACC1T5T7_9APHY|nr:hypothetical protein NM688_g3428 [Phlebia brevispora]
MINIRTAQQPLLETSNPNQMLYPTCRTYIARPASISELSISSDLPNSVSILETSDMSHQSNPVSTSANLISRDNLIKKDNDEVKDTTSQGEENAAGKPPLLVLSLNSLRSSPFMVQLELNYRACPESFNDNEAKVTLTYLKGSTLAFFELSIFDGKMKQWMDSFNEFSRVLQENFRPFNLTAEAEICPTGSRTRSLASECHTEVNHEDGSHDNTSSSNSKGKTSNSNSSGHSENFSSNTNSSNNNSSNSNKTAGSSFENSSRKFGNSGKSGKPATGGSRLASKLGKDGKLIQEERNCHLKNNLCLFCS